MNQIEIYYEYGFKINRMKNSEKNIKIPTLKKDGEKRQNSVYLSLIVQVKKQRI